MASSRDPLRDAIGPMDLRLIAAAVPDGPHVGERATGRGIHRTGRPCRTSCAQRGRISCASYRLAAGPQPRRGRWWPGSTVASGTPALSPVTVTMDPWRWSSSRRACTGHPPAGGVGRGRADAVQALPDRDPRRAVEQGAGPFRVGLGQVVEPGQVRDRCQLLAREASGVGAVEPAEASAHGRRLGGALARCASSVRCWTSASCASRSEAHGWCSQWCSCAVCRHQPCSSGMCPRLSRASRSG